MAFYSEGFQPGFTTTTTTKKQLTIVFSNIFIFLQIISSTLYVINVTVLTQVYYKHIMQWKMNLKCHRENLHVCKLLHWSVAAQSCL